MLRYAGDSAESVPPFLSFSTKNCLTLIDSCIIRETSRSGRAGSVCCHAIVGVPVSPNPDMLNRLLMIQED